jgi:hypothetical protein
MDMDQPLYRVILKRAGFVLVAIGLIDIGWMVYCIINRIAYSSSLNIFAVIAGVLLIRGGLKIAGIVRWLALLAVSAQVTVALVLPFLQPIGLWLAEIRFHTLSVVTGVAVGLFLAAALYWVAKELGREPVQIARDQAGFKRQSARVPILCGFGLVVLMSLMLAIFLNGESAERAKREAAKEVGPSFALHVTSLYINDSLRHKSVSAVVTAWNDKEVRDVSVQWQESDN